MAIQKIVQSYGLRLFDIEEVSTHGGSNRYYICKTNGKYNSTTRLNKIIKKEKSYGINKLNSYKKFAKRVIESKRKLKNLLIFLNKQKKSIISYGATYKSTTVFNFCKINSNLIKYVTDTTLNKQGKYTPGTHIKIISPEEGMNKKVDYAFLGAWVINLPPLFRNLFSFANISFLKFHVPRVKVLKR